MTEACPFLAEEYQSKPTPAEPTDQTREHTETAGPFTPQGRLTEADAGSPLNYSVWAADDSFLFLKV